MTKELGRPEALANFAAARFQMPRAELILVPIDSKSSVSNEP